MLPLLFIILVTTLGIKVSCELTHDITWMTYYMGGNVGLLLSSLILAVWNRFNKKDEDPVPFKAVI